VFLSFFAVKSDLKNSSLSFLKLSWVESRINFQFTSKILLKFGFSLMAGCSAFQCKLQLTSVFS